jgi:hypothetical protein
VVGFWIGGAFKSNPSSSSARRTCCTATASSQHDLGRPWTTATRGSYPARGRPLREPGARVFGSRSTDAHRHRHAPCCFVSVPPVAVATPARDCESPTLWWLAGPEPAWSDLCSEYRCTAQHSLVPPRAGRASRPTAARGHEQLRVPPRAGYAVHSRHGADCAACACRCSASAVVADAAASTASVKAAQRDRISPCLRRACACRGVCVYGCACVCACACMCARMCV